LEEGAAGELRRRHSSPCQASGRNGAECEEYIEAMSRFVVIASRLEKQEGMRDAV
jgi:hypothetical protein